MLRKNYATEALQEKNANAKNPLKYFFDKADCMALKKYALPFAMGIALSSCSVDRNMEDPRPEQFMSDYVNIQMGSVHADVAIQRVNGKVAYIYIPGPNSNAPCFYSAGFEKECKRFSNHSYLMDNIALKAADDLLISRDNLDFCLARAISASENEKSHDNGKNPLK